MVKKLVELSSLHLGARDKLIAEQVDRSLVDRPRYVTIACGLRCSFRNLDVCRLPDPNRWLVLKLADSLLHFIGYRRGGRTFLDRQRD